MAFPSSPSDQQRYRRWRYNSARAAWEQLDIQNTLYWLEVSGSGQAVRGENYLADTSGGSFILTLPSKVSVNDMVRVFDATRSFDKNPLTLACADQPINGSTLMLTLPDNGLYLAVFVDENIGWRVSYEGLMDWAPAAFQGSSYGYSTAGYYPSATNVIEKWSFTADGNASDVGDLTVAVGYRAGTSSATHGYCAGGYLNTNVIEKFPFASDGNASDVGDLLAAAYGGGGQSSPTHGYCSGTCSNVIQKYPFATDSNSTDVGDLPNSPCETSGSTSSTHGYASAGHSVTLISKFAFATDGNATSVGDLISARGSGCCASSTTHGYTGGGTTTTTIEKFTFASDNDATLVGNLTGYRMSGGASSTTHGYASGSSHSVAPMVTIEKWTFASDNDSTDVGDLTVSHGMPCLPGQQI